MAIADFLGPIQGMLLGVLLVILRVAVATRIQALFEKFPVYEKKFSDFTVKPKDISVLGVIFFSVAFLGFVRILNA